MKRRELLIVSAGIATTGLLVAGTGNTQTKTALKGETVNLAKGLQGYYVTPPGKGAFPAVMVFM